MLGIREEIIKILIIGRLIPAGTGFKKEDNDKLDNYVIPKILTLLGASLVIASSLIIFMRENKLKKQIIAPRT